MAESLLRIYGFLSKVLGVLRDSQYSKSYSTISEKPHHYGKNVHLLSDPFHESLLAKFSVPETLQPEANRLAEELSRFLTIQAVNFLFPQHPMPVRSRMATYHAEADFEARLLSSEPKAVTVDLMRAGILPSQICFETLHQFLRSENIRQDHILLNRKVNAKEEVVGVQMSGHKIGGGVDGAFVFFPDPMGATGSTLSAVLELYQNLEKIDRKLKGSAQKFIALHFIVTPEYLKKMRKFSKVLEIFALRLDRGLSSKKILQTELGRHWEKERGLNEKQYIVPGAGGIGEILNNSFV